MIDVGENPRQQPSEQQYREAFPHEIYAAADEFDTGGKGANLEGILEKNAIVSRSDKGALVVDWKQIYTMLHDYHLNQSETGRDFVTAVVEFLRERSVVSLDPHGHYALKVSDALGGIFSRLIGRSLYFASPDDARKYLKSAYNEPMRQNVQIILMQVLPSELPEAASEQQPVQSRRDSKAYK